MRTRIRQWALATGIVLVVLGIGNWIISWNKVLEYELRIAHDPIDTGVTKLDDFPELDPVTDAAIMKRLHHGRDAEYSAARAKVDFYSVVNTGGRFMIVVGCALIGVVLFWPRREELHPPGIESSAGAPG